MAKYDDDLFYVCALLDAICRKTHNSKNDIVRILERDQILQLYRCAGVDHCEVLEDMRDEYIQKYRIPSGNFDPIARAKYAVPTSFDMGAIYERLISSVAEEKEMDRVDALMEVFSSFLCDQIENFNSALYYEAPQNHVLYYREGKVF